jgi:hypothetical protein
MKHSNTSIRREMTLITRIKHPLNRLGNGRLLLALWLCLVAGAPASLLAQGTAFTYQGRLNDNGGPANGTYDLQFTVFDSGAGPNLVAGPLTNAATAVSNGQFLVTLEFDGVELAVGSENANVHPSFTVEHSDSDRTRWWCRRE